MKLTCIKSGIGVAALLLATSASAQTTTAEGTTMGQQWPTPVADTFFNPGPTPTLRPEGEIRTSWASLSEEQKEQVRTDCAAFGTQGASGADRAADAGGAAGAAPDGTIAGGAATASGAASATGQPTGAGAAGVDDTTGQPDTKVSQVGESDATTSDMGTSAGPGTSNNIVSATDPGAGAPVTGSPSEQGTGATTNPGASGATVGTGEGTMQGTGTSASTAVGGSGTSGGEFDAASVSLTTWTQICQMVETL